MAILILFAVAALIVVALIQLFLTGPPPPAPPWETSSNSPRQNDRVSDAMDEAARSSQERGAWYPRGWRRLHVVLLCVATASVVALIVQRVVPPPATDLALMCAVWITFYPVARLIAFLLAQRQFQRHLRPDLEFRNLHAGVYLGKPAAVRWPRG
jgi:hypothetical protein